MFTEQKDHQYDTYYKYFRRKSLNSEDLVPLFQPKKRDVKRKEKLSNSSTLDVPLHQRRVRLPRRKIDK